MPNKKEGKYIHRIGQLKQRIVWEADRCPKAGPVGYFSLLLFLTLNVERKERSKRKIC